MIRSSRTGSLIFQAKKLPGDATGDGEVESDFDEEEDVEKPVGNKNGDVVQVGARINY